MQLRWKLKYPAALQSKAEEFQSGQKKDLWFLPCSGSLHVWKKSVRKIKSARFLPARKAENVVVDFAEGDMIVVIGGVWKDTCGVITAMNHNKQTVTINVDLFGRETPVEVSFADVKKMN